MNRDPFNSAFDMFRMMANAAQAFNRFQGSAAPDAPNSSAQAQQVLQLYQAFVNSGFRYLARWADISARRYPGFAETLAAVNADPKNNSSRMSALVDEVRAYLREMAELPLAESERLQAEIEKIVKAGGSAPEPTEDAPRQRRARAKK